VVAAMRRDSFDEEVSESELLIQAMRSGIRDFLRRPISSSELSAMLSRIVATERSVEFKRGHVISFLSNKGGVGKSTLAVNTAYGLARRYPGEVLLIDASLQMGVCASLLDLQSESSLIDAVEERDRLDSTLLRQLAVEHPGGLHLLAAPANAIEAARVRDDDMSRIISVARRTYDYVVIDTFPVLDSVVISILDFTQRGYIVLENVLPTLQGGIRLLEVLAGLGFPADRQRLILNREVRVSGSLSSREVADRMQRPIDHQFPYDKQVIVAANTGTPIHATASRLSHFKRGIENLIAEIQRDLPPHRPRLNGHVPREFSISSATRQGEHE
jgi:pilus assembly protein CpaE